MPTTTTTTTTTPSTPPKIAIIGGGPAGLTLARLLHTHGIPSTIFEKDASASSHQNSGGSLDLHEESGQRALRASNLWAEFQAHARYDGEDVLMTDRAGTALVEVRGADAGRPEIDRAALVQILRDSVPDSWVCWSRRVRNVLPEEGKLCFCDGGEEAGFDLIVGADGAWSRVRPCLTTVTPFYAGVSCVELWIQNPATTAPDVDELVGSGTVFAWGEDAGACFAAQRNGSGSICVYAFVRQHETWLQDQGVDWSDLEAAKRAILPAFEAFAPHLRRVLLACDSRPRPRPLFMLPVGLRWPHRARVTLLGDAAHLMTPFAGEGVNAGMADAVELAEAIVRGVGKGAKGAEGEGWSNEDLDAAVREYERTMFPRAEKLMKLTWDSLQERFEPGGGKSMADRIRFLLEQREKGKRVVDGGLWAE